jgi:hypothetical protein
LNIGKDGSDWTHVGLEYLTRISVVQLNAPFGFTKVTGFDDRLMRIEDAGGGATGGTWTIGGITVDSHTHSVTATGGLSTDGAHTHTVNSHTHSVNTASRSVVGAPSTVVLDNTDPNTGPASPATNSQGSHTHSFTGTPATSGTASTGGTTSDASWRPLYVDVIVCEKDVTL